MCYLDDGDRADVWNESQVVARKRHICDVCRLHIAPGVRHTRIGTLFDGRWSTLRIHGDCYELTCFIQIDVCGQDSTFIGVDSLRDQVAEHMHDEQGREVVSRYRRVLRSRIREGVWP
jgi:hypothetical protein